jgi:hypothetical protein
MSRTPPTDQDLREAAKSFLTQTIKRSEQATDELGARIDKDGVVEALRWCAISTLERGAKARPAQGLLKALNGGNWKDLDDLRNYCLAEVTRALGSLYGSRSTNPLESLVTVAEGHFWSELAELLGAIKR